MSLDFLKNYSCIVDYMSFKLLNAATSHSEQSAKLQETAVHLKKVAWEMDQISKDVKQRKRIKTAH